MIYSDQSLDSIHIFLTQVLTRVILCTVLTQHLHTQDLSEPQNPVRQAKQALAPLKVVKQRRWDTEFFTQGCMVHGDKFGTDTCVFWFLSPMQKHSNRGCKIPSQQKMILLYSLTLLPKQKEMSLDRMTIFLFCNFMPFIMLSTMGGRGLGRVPMLMRRHSLHSRWSQSSRK